MRLQKDWAYETREIRHICLSALQHTHNLDSLPYGGDEALSERIFRESQQ